MSSAISVRWLNVNVSWGAVIFETNYGLMQHSFTEIKSRLLRALDSEYNVVDMATVFEVVAILEKAPITQEILETTRIGRIINLFRHRTSNKELAKRAKDLLRCWRHLINPAEQRSSASSAAGTEVQTTNAAAVIPNANAVASASSNALPSSTSHNGGSAVRLPATTISPPSSSSEYSTGNQIATEELCIDRNEVVRRDGVSGLSSVSPEIEPRLESVPKTHAANKRLRKNAFRGNSTVDEDEPPTKITKVNGTVYADGAARASVSSHNQYHHRRHLAPHHQRRRRHEHDDNEKSNEDDDGGGGNDEDRSAPSVATVAANSPLETYQREDEPNCTERVTSEPEPEVSRPAPKKRGRKKSNKKKNTEDDYLKEKLNAASKAQRVKTTEELVASLKSCGETSVDVSQISTAEPQVKQGTSAEIDDLLNADPETRVEREIELIMSKLPPLDVDQIRWDSSETPPPSFSPRPVTDEEVERYLNDKWEGVNGCVTHAPAPVPSAESTAVTADTGSAEAAQTKRDPTDAFREWHEMVARRTTNDDLIHILPYSIVD